MVAFGVYQMNSFVDDSVQQPDGPRMDQQQFEGRGPNGGQPPMEREQTEISLADISVGQTVSVMGIETDETLVAETVMLMSQDFASGRGPGEGMPIPADDERPQFQGGPNGFPEGRQPPSDFGDRAIGEVVSINTDAMVLTSLEGESITVSLTSATKYLSF